MYNFILTSRPLSFNSCKGDKKTNYKKALKTAFRNYNPTHTLLTGELYASVYYFFKKNLYLDADNLSKPVWDCLKGFLYTDDRQIKLRTAASYDLTKDDYKVIDFSGLKGSLIVDLVEAFECEEHIIYIECGSFKASMLKLNIE